MTVGFAVPEVVRNKARVAGADQWLEDLPQCVAALASEWGLTVGSPFTDATEALVLSVVDGAGEKAVLKICLPHGPDVARAEIDVLRLAGGDGCVRLLRHDLDRGAMLLERLGPSMAELGLPYAERLRLLARAASSLWRPAPSLRLPSGAEKARALSASIVTRWEALDRPCSEAAIDHALACAEGRETAHDDATAVLVHGDIHQWNALRADDGGFRLVDPDGYRAEPALDLGVLMREDPEELMTDADPRTRARELEALTGVDAEATWEWGVVERVSTGLLCEQIGLQPVGRQMLAAADRLALTERR